MENSVSHRPQAGRPTNENCTLSVRIGCNPTSVRTDQSLYVSDFPDSHIRDSLNYVEIEGVRSLPADFDPLQANPQRLSAHDLLRRKLLLRHTIEDHHTRVSAHP
jgi:hypothetical protein